ncbi:MAG: hypothetical protein OHK0040_06810 [bacterium]
MKRVCFLFLSLLVFIFVSFACAPDPYKQSFERAKQMMTENNVYDAYAVLKDLCAKMPTEKEYCDLYNDARGRLYNVEVKEIGGKIASLKAEKPLIPLPILNELYKDFKRIESYGLKTQELDNIGRQIANERRLTENRKNEGMERAKSLFNDQEYAEAINVLQNIRYLDEDNVSEVINEYKEKAMTLLYPKITERIAKDDWSTAHRLLKTANLVNPDYKNVKSLLKEAEEKDSGEYNLRMGDEARKTRKYDKALEYYKIAMSYPDTKDRAEQLFYNTKLDLCDFYFVAGIELMEQDLNKQAFDNFKKAFDVMNDLPLEKKRMVKVPKRELQKFYDTLYLKAKKAEDSENLGIAYQYYKLIATLAPTYPEIKENIRKAEDKVANRALKSMAVIPFKSPKSAPESGNMFTSAIMLTLYNELRQDMKIIERESMDVLLREYELTMAGKGGDKPKDATSFQISSADYLLLGDVLDYRVDSSVQEGSKVVRVKTRVEFIPNPDYEEWVKNAKRLQESGQPVPPSPPKLIEKPIYEDIKYKVTFYKKVGIISISYRIVDSARGKIIHTGIADIKKDANDESSEGVEIGDFKIPFRMAQLPTDTELIKKAQEEAVAKIAGEVKSLFKDPEEKYLKQAEQLEKDGNIKEALERYTDAMILLKKKNKDVTVIEQKISKYIDALSSL